jgi:hypothetical protein
MYSPWLEIVVVQQRPAPHQIVTISRDTILVGAPGEFGHAIYVYESKWQIRRQRPALGTLYVREPGARPAKLGALAVVGQLTDTLAFERTGQGGDKVPL